MRLPELDAIPSKELSISEFDGLNDNIFASENYVRDEKNMTSDFFPTMASRKERQIIEIDLIDKFAECNGKTIFFQNGSAYIYFEEGYTEEIEIEGNVEKIIKYGAYLILLPQKIMINTAYNAADPNSRKIIKLETKEQFKQSTQKYANMYLSDKNGVPFVVLTETAYWGGRFTAESDTQGQIIDSKINEYLRSTGDFAGGGYNTLYPNFIKTKSVTYRDAQPTELRKAHIVYGAKSAVMKASEKTSYEMYLGDIDAENNIILKSYNYNMQTWNVPKYYITIWISNQEKVRALKENIKTNDYIKFECLQSDETEYAKNDEEPLRKYLKDKYIKVENVLYDENETQIGIVIADPEANFLKSIKDRDNFLKIGSYREDSEDHEVGVIKRSVYSLRTILGCPNSHTGTGAEKENLCLCLNIIKDMPEMDYLTVCDNRVWGCSNKKHEVYACKQGDPTSWHTYAGIASDSYAMTIGSNGEFTGAYTYRGRPYFFKEDLIINIYGDKPSNYQLNEIFESGVEINSTESLVELNGYLYYKSRQGICRFNGQQATVISEPLGQDKFYSAMAGASDNKLYVSMKKISENVRKMYVYDSKTDQWHIEDDLSFDYFYKIKDSLYGIKQDNSNYKSNLYRLDGITNIIDTMTSGTTYSYKKEFEDYAFTDFTLHNHGVEWYAVTGDIEAGVENKYIQKLGIRFDIAKNAYIKIKVKYDNDTKWTDAYIHTGKKDMDAVNVTLRPHRCKRFKMRFEGQGMVKIHEIKRIINKGSDFK